MLCTVWVGTYYFGYYQGWVTTNNENKIILLEQQNKYNSDMQELLNNVRQKEQELQEKIVAIEQDTEQKLQMARGDYESVINDLHSDKFTYSGLLNNKTNICPESNMPAKPENTNKVKCYTESDLRSRVERSLAIGQKCDELAIKYNELLLFLKQANSKE